MSAAAARHRSSTALRVLREQQALDLRIAGASYRQIAERVGVSLSTAHADVERVLRRTMDKLGLDCEVWVALEMETLGALQVKAMALVAQGNLEAMRTVLAIQAQRAKYLGLYAPNRTEITGKEGGAIEYHVVSESELDAEIRGLLGALAERGEGEAQGAPALLMEPVDPGETEAT